MNGEWELFKKKMVAMGKKNVTDDCTSQNKFLYVTGSNLRKINEAYV
jgi:hypothetical protein